MVLIPGILLLIPDPLAFRSRALALISAPTYFVTTLKWRFLKEKLKASLYYPASVISALWLEGKDRWRGEGDKARGYSSPRGGEGGGAARSNPDRISDQKMSFSTAILEPSKIYSRGDSDLAYWHRWYIHVSRKLIRNRWKYVPKFLWTDFFFSKWKTRKLLRDTLSTA